MYESLLRIHIAGGVVVLLAPAAALATSKGSRWHIVSGRAFVLGMFVVFLTALPMTLLRPNVFLFGVAVVSFYFALSGWLRARNRGGADFGGLGRGNCDGQRCRRDEPPGYRAHPFWGFERNRAARLRRRRRNHRSS